MAKKIQTKTRTSTTTLVGVALLAGAGLAAAAGMAVSSMRSPALLVRLTPRQTLHQVAVGGTEDATLLSLDLMPRGGEATVSELTLSVFGDLDDDFSSIDRDADADERFTQCSLEQTDGTVVAGPEPVSSGYLTFNDTLVVPANTTATYEIHCDLSSYGESGGDPDRFAMSIGGEPGIDATIGGTVLSGTTLVIGNTAYDTLNATGGVSTSITTEGTLHVSIAPDTAASDILLGSTTHIDIGRWEMRAEGEDFLADTISFKADGSVSAASTATLTCESEDGSEYSDTQSVVSGEVTFDTDCYVRVGEPAGMRLHIDTNPIGTTGVDSGDTVRFAFNASGLDFRAVGMTSGSEISEHDVATDVYSRAMTLRQSEPTFSLSSSTPSGSGVPGVSETLEFNVAAASSGDVAIRQLLFRVSTTDNGGTGWNNCGDGGSKKRFGANELWKLYDSDDLSTPISDDGDWSLLKADGSACGQAAVPVAYAILNLGAVATTGIYDVSAGTAPRLVLKTDMTGASAMDDDSIRIDLASAADARAIRRQAVLWDDTDAGVTNINELFLQALPLLGSTITF